VAVRVRLDGARNGEPGQGSSGALVYGKERRGMERCGSIGGEGFGLVKRGMAV